MYRRLSDVGRVQVYTLLCKNAPLPRARFVRALCGQWVRLERSDKLLVARLLATRRWRISLRTVHDRSNLGWLERLSPDVGLHAMSVIYRRPLLDCFRLGVLNAHIGLLPQYRGRSVVEWSLFNGDPTGITTFFVDEGIDTGEHIVQREVVDVRGLHDLAAAKQHLRSLADDMYASAVGALQSPSYGPLRNDGSGRRYYVMSELFREVVEEIMRQGCAPSARTATDSLDDLRPCAG
ncbi:MAG: hypothetical protein HY690_04380 [Chloroflexi bacterium]|nr:hypothetical protein [Chloroflexota bacterium]